MLMRKYQSDTGCGTPRRAFPTGREALVLPVEMTPGKRPDQLGHTAGNRELLRGRCAHRLGLATTADGELNRPVPVLVLMSEFSP